MVWIVHRSSQNFNYEIGSRKIGRRIGHVFGSPPDYWIHLRELHEFRRAVQEHRARKADRTPYPPEFRRRLVALARDGRDLRELAFEYECSDTSIRRWMRDAERDDEAGDGGSYAPRKQPGLF